MKPMPEDWQRAVAAVAHPDDLEYGAAAAVARWTAQGRDVSYVIATRGEAGIAGMPRIACARSGGGGAPQRGRRRRARSGVSRSPGRPGGVRHTAAPRPGGEFRRLRPDVVITMNFDLTWGDSGCVNHADHRAVGLAVIDACRDAANPWLFPDAGPPWSGIKHAYVAASNEPTHFVDVTATLEAGIASLREHADYIEGLGREFDPDEFLRNMAGFVGLGAGCEYAVGFRRYETG